MTVHSSELGTWELVSRAPDPRLRWWVGDYHGYSERLTVPMRRQEGPISGIPMIISFGQSWTIIEPGGASYERTSFVAGLAESYVHVEDAGNAHSIQVNLTPLGAHAILGLAMHTLTDRVVELPDLLGELTALELVERLAAAPSWGVRFDLLDDFFMKRLMDTPLPSTAWAWARLRRSAGRAEIGPIADELGWSHRRLVREFRDQIGLPPKMLGRVMRFERATELMREARPLGEVAHECGYYDQAHMNRDFAKFVAASPGNYAARLMPDGGIAA